MIQVLDKTELVVGDTYLLYKNCHYKYIYIGVCCFSNDYGFIKNEFYCKSHLDADWRSSNMECTNFGNAVGTLGFNFDECHIFKLTDDERASVMSGVI